MKIVIIDVPGIYTTSLEHLLCPHSIMVLTDDILKKMCINPPDLIFMAQNFMSDIWDVLKNNSRLSQIPIIIISEKDVIPDVIGLLHKGAYGIVMKPYVAAGIQNMLHKVDMKVLKNNLQSDLESKQHITRSKI